MSPARRVATSASQNEYALGDELPFLHCCWTHSRSSPAVLLLFTSRHLLLASPGPGPALKRAASASPEKRSLASACPLRLGGAAQHALLQHHNQALPTPQFQKLLTVLPCPNETVTYWTQLINSVVFEVLPVVVSSCFVLFCACLDLSPFGYSNVPWFLMCLCVALLLQETSKDCVNR